MRFGGGGDHYEVGGGGAIMIRIVFVVAVWGLGIEFVLFVWSPLVVITRPRGLQLVMRKAVCFEVDAVLGACGGYEHAKTWWV